MARWAVGDVQGCCDELETDCSLAFRFSERLRPAVAGWRPGQPGTCVARGAAAGARPRRQRHQRARQSRSAPARGRAGRGKAAAAAITLKRDPGCRRSRCAAGVAAVAAAGALRTRLLRPACCTPACCHNGARLRRCSWRRGGALATRQSACIADHHVRRSSDRWRAALAGLERQRFTINRADAAAGFCTADGRVDFKQKGKPDSAPSPWLPWFRVAGRASADQADRVGHWSALGFCMRTRRARHRHRLRSGAVR